MLSKIFHTASYRRKLPVPFFEVLDQEYAALLGGEKTRFTWDFKPDHLRDSANELFEEIKPLLPPGDQETLPHTVSKENLVLWLNKVLQTPRNLYDHPRFPKALVSREMIAMAGLDLDSTELARLNRLLLEEAFPEHLRRIHDIHLTAIYRRIHEGRGCAALCFSGGGIRSATFALGVAQGMARRGLLEHFDYLSTVSGGGYIGSWLSSWIHRAGGQKEVFTALKTVRAETPTEPEPKPLRHLRMFSNYLSPKLGAFSVDTWVLVAIYLRNLLLNWLVFVPILFALLAVPRFHVSLLNIAPPAWLILGGFIVGYALAACAIAYCIVNRPADRESLRKHGGSWFERRDQEGFLKWCLAPLCIAAISVTTSWAWAQRPADAGFGSGLVARGLHFLCGTPGIEPPALWHYLLLGAVLHLIGWDIAESVLKRWKDDGWVSLGREIVLVIFTGATGGLVLWAAAAVGSKRINESPGLALYSCLAVPMFLVLFLLAATLFIGVASNRTSDDDREWWARMGAWLLILVVGWSVFSALVLFGPLGLLGLPKVLGTLGGLSGLFTLIVGYSGRSATGKERMDREGLAAVLLNKALSLAAPLSLAALVAGLSLATSLLLIVATEKMRDWLPGLPNFPTEPFARFNRVVHETPWWLAGGFLAVAAIFGYALSRFINVNKFSLHAIYRSRLVRAYPGASNFKRQPNPFTGFDPADNLPLQELRDPRDPTLPQRPLHIINMALNLVTGENLAWQQRKAETFTASTLFCGNFRLGYRFTKHYALNHENKGLSLGTSIAISGAAASPNQGYHSSPMVALLMTLFNVRLGWWLGNPGAMGHNTFRDSSPRSQVLHFVKEGLGLTDSTSPYVYLSDGGHFENLGLYEMILRRCRVIVVSDAGCDAGCALEDLGNAIRKIRVDLGVPIEIQQFDIHPRAEGGKEAGKYCAVGIIDYGTTDEGGAKGALIYLKPALCGDEPRDIYNYARASAQFPHESTGDQWFSESQFESYRALGQHVIDRIYETTSQWQAPVGQSYPGLEEFVARARNYAGRQPGNGNIAIA